MVDIEQVSQSKVRLKIAGLISTRPFTLGELADLTSISVQGVLKHLKKLARTGLVREEHIKSGRYLSARKLYFIPSHKVLDYSDLDVVVAMISRARSSRDDEEAPTLTGPELEGAAEEMIFVRRRVRDLARRLRKTMAELAAQEATITRTIQSLPLTPEEKQITYLLLSEESTEEARDVLRRRYGCDNPDIAIRETLLKLKGVRPD